MGDLHYQFLEHKSKGSTPEIFICVCIGIYTISCLHTVHGFSSASYDVEEGESLETIFELNVKGETRFPMLLMPGNITAEPSGTARTFMLSWQ